VIRENPRKSVAELFFVGHSEVSEVKSFLTPGSVPNSSVYRPGSALEKGRELW